MQNEIEQNVDVIDLGAASIVTQGGNPEPGSDLPAFQRQIGIED
ncbi:benenodin family lasso peptide [Sphingobium naphthae]|nr:benenodin family lasso peptide [Sphingobium naphthae]